MKLLYVAMEHRSYGDRGHEVKVAEEMARQGHSVHLVTDQAPTWRDGEKPDTLHFCGAFPLNDPSKTSEIQKMTGFPTDCDAAFASSASGAPLLAEWKKTTGKPTLAQVLDFPAWRIDWGDRGPWLKQWTPWYQALLKCDRVVANMKRTHEGLIEYADAFGAKEADFPTVDVLYYGIDTEAADAAKVPERPMNDRRRCVNASRLVPYKGFDLGIMAIGLLPWGKRPIYHMIGDGEDLMRLGQLCQWCDVPNVFLPGVSDEIKFGVTKACDFALSLSFNPDVPSQFPLEAVYLGKPAIAADVPINRDRYGDCPGGLAYVPPFDTHAISEEIRTWTDISGFEWPEHGTTRVRYPDGLRTSDPPVQAARKWIQENRSFKSHAQSILNALGALAK